jgi:TolB-like protein/DNA-binding winged helix-turn-helix (wHTH) protein
MNRPLDLPLIVVDLSREPDFSIGMLRVCPSHRQVSANGHRETVQPRVMQVLVALTRAKGAVLSRDNLIEACWDGVVVGDDAINRCIAKVRQIAELGGGLHFEIETIPRVGYRLAPIPTTANASAERITQEPNDGHVASRFNSTKSADHVAPIRSRVARPDAGAIPSQSAASTSASTAIAVLPLVNLSQDPDQEYFSDGLAEELINQLAQIDGLRVAGRSSTFAFKGKSEDIRIIGEKLGVGNVLEGSVRKAGQRLRITARLIQCSDGLHLWSERFDREFTDIFQIQDEIARAVSDALSVKLQVGSRARSGGGTSNAKAYDLVLRARAIIRRRERGDAERAVALLEEALAIDPDFALAWNVLGNAFTSVLSWGPENPENVRKRIAEALDRSIQLAPGLWTAHEAYANLLELRHDWVAAEQANIKSRELAPKSMREPIISRSNQLAIVGRVEEALPFALESARLEPLAPNLNVQYALDLSGRHDEAEAEYERCKDLPLIDC